MRLHKNRSSISRVIRAAIAVSCAVLLTATTFSSLQADPCGMVPPIYTGKGSPIARTGLQQTYVFFDKGVESFVIRPAFEGKVDNFGMLIPFPTAPALRKVPDNVFEQIANAVDPPEVVVDLRPRPEMMAFGGAAFDDAEESGPMRIRNEIKVLKQEAVGMYEVAVLEAGSAEALKRWMDKNKFVYPKGMDKVTNEYIKEGWCFVAVKTKVGAKSDAEPRPGQRSAKPEMPTGSVFDGTVQGLGFRFKTDELVVPMRLSAFNEGELRNVVYLLSRGGKKIRSIPEEYVVRQISGKRLVQNLTKPLPLRVIGGTEKDIPDYRRKNLKTERDPKPHNGQAKHLFSSDVLATIVAGLSHRHEETEKELLRIGEHFGLRGKEIDTVIEEVSGEEAEKLAAKAIPQLEELTLTVVDGDFPREVLANENLRFTDFEMAASRNNPQRYNTPTHGPTEKKEGKLISWNLDDRSLDQLHAQAKQTLAAQERSITLTSFQVEPMNQPEPSQTLNLELTGSSSGVFHFTMLIGIGLVCLIVIAAVVTICVKALSPRSH